MKQPASVNMALGALLYKTLPEYAPPTTKRDIMRDAVRKNSKLSWLNKLMEACRI